MERTYKTWGEKFNLFQNDLCETSVLELLPNQRCSWHKHQAKYNLFYVIEGAVFIKTQWGPALVEKGQTFTTKPGEWHEFQTLDKCATLLEIMYVKYDAEDIHRETLGGPLECHSET